MEPCQVPCSGCGRYADECVCPSLSPLAKVKAGEQYRVRCSCFDTHEYDLTIPAGVDRTPRVCHHCGEEAEFILKSETCSRCRQPFIPAEMVLGMCLGCDHATAEVDWAPGEEDECAE
jgi:hypothetical protein